MKKNHPCKYHENKTPAKKRQFTVIPYNLVQENDIHVHCMQS